MSIESNITDRFSMLGVVNITPNSFSDGGKIKTSSDTLNHVRDLYDQGCRFFDIGAESTAPFNDKVEQADEFSRMNEFFIPLLDEFDFSDCSISIDTYKPDVFEFCYKEIRKRFSNIEILWNDVSGVVDESTLEVLKKCSNATYCLSHTNCPTKDTTSNHMDFVLDRDIFSQVNDHFKKSLKFLNEVISAERIYLDPCFGFSKSYEQNLDLIEKMDSLSLEFSDMKWLLGISKKSFLQKMLGDKLASEDKGLNRRRSEFIHCNILANWMKTLKGSKVLIRLHDPKVFNLSVISHQLF